MKRKTSMSDSIGTTTYTYDALGRRTQRIDDREKGEKGARPPIRLPCARLPTCGNSFGTDVSPSCTVAPWAVLPSS